MPFHAFINSGEKVLHSTYEQFMKSYYQLIPKSIAKSMQLQLVSNTALFNSHIYMVIKFEGNDGDGIDALNCYLYKGLTSPIWLILNSHAMIKHNHSLSNHHICLRIANNRCNHSIYFTISSVPRFLLNYKHFHAII